MRAGGVLMHISSLPSPYGIGTMGKEAKQFVDFLEKSGQTYWQILPICPTGYGDSPYQSYSGYAGNPYLIDLDELCKMKLLTKKECTEFSWGSDATHVSFELLRENRGMLYKKVWNRFRKNVPEDFDTFCKKNEDWLSDFALFMALKDAHEGAPWMEWEEQYKVRDWNALERAKATYADSMLYYKMLQYLFYKQWEELKSYANHKGIRIIGDIPIYVAADSADVWANPTQFYLNENLEPIDVAGCPPDAFSEDGQLWGNPLYRWDVMKKDGYRWWVKRLSYMSTLYDVIRIDHFRGFDSYYAIPAKDTTARNGEWRKGPGIELFNACREQLGELDIIVEDLGYLTPSVLQLVADTGFPGMKVLQFAFDGGADNSYLPHTYPNHCVVYTGTHDNDTVLGWLKTAPKGTVSFAKTYMRLTKEEGYHWGVMRTAWASVADLAIVPMQDILGLSSEGRMNTPSTVGGNWQWRMKKGQISAKLAKKIAQNMQTYARMRR